jgi:chemotaxis protein methyltransferase CheR
MITDKDIEIIIEAFNKSSDFDFSQYSEKSLHRRLEKILINHNMSSTELASKITSNNKFLEEIKNEITVNTTELFRDTEIWILINDIIIPHLKKLNKINIWVAGTSSGEEVYSLMILLKYHGLLDKSSIIGTDLNNRIIEVAKKAEYKNNIIADYIKNFDDVFKTIKITNKPNITDFFNIDKKTRILSAKSFLRNKVNFFTHNLVNNSSDFEGKFDLIMCRNVLIYFNMNLQTKIIKNFHTRMNKNASLVLGAHECIMNPLESKFIKKSTIYTIKE